VTSVADSLLRLSVVIPCYNEAEGMAELYRRVTAACREAVGEDHEIVLVNDGSRDATWTVMTDLARRDPAIVAVNLSRNYGHQLALSAGLRICRGQRVFILDADLQDPPELLGPMMRRMDAGVDVVYGRRIHRAGETRFKKFTAALFYRLLDRLADVEIPVDTGDFRLMSRRALDALNQMPEHHRFIRGMVSWIGFAQVPLDYHRQERFAGETKYPLSKMLRFAVDAITGFSVRPLRIASYLGLTSGMGAAALMVYALLSWLRGSVVEGWTSLTMIVLFVSSCQLMVAGLMGEYLGRLYVESKRRPLYIVQDIVRLGGAETANLEVGNGPRP
jgi:glycosyltransferase involved in cell wall biosynthesis